MRHPRHRIKVPPRHEARTARRGLHVRLSEKAVQGCGLASRCGESFPSRGSMLHRLLPSAITPLGKYWARSKRRRSCGVVVNMLTGPTASPALSISAQSEDARARR